MNPQNQENKENREVSTANTTVTQGEIVDVWEENFEQELDRLAELIDRYPYVAMDTEFPGICYQGDNVAGYTLIKNNVDALKLIQVGVSICDEQGNAPQPVSTWQFNLRFDLGSDQHATDSIDMLKEAGINFEELACRGIEPLYFADCLTSSGLIYNEDVHWVTFHGAFDFAYLVKQLANHALPGTLEKFHSLLKVLFPTLVDIKIMLKEVPDLKNSSLSKLSRDLDVRRVGAMHQAGSDADLTLRCFFKLKELYFDKGIGAQVMNKVYGLNAEYAPQPPPAALAKPAAQQPLDVQKMAMYQPYAHQPHMGYYGYPGAEYSPATYYYNHLELPMLYANMNSTGHMADYSTPYKL